ncbi:MAG: isoprenyl transferase [Vicinamibacteria bacterium]|jgi:undecaprenyl diphosphate synthase|nr:isoprenyl transferase [Vicinamibacteria bacterium]
MGLDQLLEVIPHDSDEVALARGLDFTRLPRHIAIIMDGNGRWAKERHKRRIEGHRAGIASVRETVETCARLGVEVLTLYAFSVENWKRPKTEVGALMGLLKHFLRAELNALIKNSIRFKVIGRMGDLPADVQKELLLGMQRTSACDGMQFNIALNYGGRTEIVDAVRSLMQHARGSTEIDEAGIARHLYTAGQPDPDLLIRTSGELRVSNFLLWQIAYAEIWVTNVLWPDFRRRHLFEAIQDFQRRERRYGGIVPA